MFQWCLNRYHSMILIWCYYLVSLLAPPFLFCICLLWPTINSKKTNGTSSFDTWKKYKLFLQKTNNVYCFLHLSIIINKSAEKHFHHTESKTKLFLEWQPCHFTYIKWSFSEIVPTLTNSSKILEVTKIMSF